jgi:MoaA/NifB/PqqE/SkfB family radical SAM enzyme
MRVDELESEFQKLKRKCDYYFSTFLPVPLSAPEHVYFSLTNRCNLKCKMCDVRNYPSQPKEELTTEKCRDIINESNNIGIDHIVFSGGEPLLREDIFDLIGYAIDAKIKIVDIITNGTLIDDSMASKLIKSGINHITFSLDGLGRVNDAIRGQGCFKKVTQAIDLINKYKGIQPFPTLAINFTIMGNNIDDILPMVELAKEKKCNRILFQPVLCNNIDMDSRFNKHEAWVDKKDLPKLKKVVKKLIEEKGTRQDLLIDVDSRVLEMIPCYFSGKALDCGIKCYEAIVRIVVSCNGDLWSCAGVYGNVKKSSLRESWFSEKAISVRNKARNCKNHCLQGCIYFPGATGIYSIINEFIKQMKLFNGTRYFTLLPELLENYRRLINKNMQRNDSGVVTELYQLSEIISSLSS